MSQPQNTLTPAQRYAVTVARATVEAYQVHGTEAVARWAAPAAAGTLAPAPADLPGGLVFAYDIAMRQIRQLLAIIDILAAS